jgi:hypothetical protein
MKTIRTFAWAAALSALAMTVSAQPRQDERSHLIDERQARQEQRIERGVARGHINPREARQLWRQQRDIARAEARARADGRITRQEMNQLVAMLDTADRQIRHERWDRPGYRG